MLSRSNPNANVKTNTDRYKLPSETSLKQINSFKAHSPRKEQQKSPHLGPLLFLQDIANVLTRIHDGLEDGCVDGLDGSVEQKQAHPVIDHHETGLRVSDREGVFKRNVARHCIEVVYPKCGTGAP